MVLRGVLLGGGKVPSSIDPKDLLSVEKILNPAIHWWWVERKQRGLNIDIRSLIDFAFKVWDSLYFVVIKFPDLWQSGWHLNHYIS